MINWLLEKWFGKDEPQVYKRTPEQEEMFKEMKHLMNALGMEYGNDGLNWFRLHQILHDHANRLKALEGK